ncbi:hypothetical protein [Kingella negevensis]|uniref:hypothetical protein n=1 Tax=Kingella negevensis TaxID=1522312 RepID=UPI00050A33DF|nr:hypothetical protein [Kingella negevensis]MDK4688301.1 hypothetical protein [Kingella negevensis]WII91922.1 hypothetical protein QEO93_04905 [Kingella negevensis]
MINNDNLSVIPAKRYFTIEEACDLAGITTQQLTEWQLQECLVLGKGANVLTRSDVMKLRQMRYAILSVTNMDSFGNPAISNDEMRSELKDMLASIQKVLAPE